MIFFYIFDISDPIAPVELGHYVSRSEITALSVTGNYAYLGIEALGFGLKIIDISDPGSLDVVGSYDIVDSPYDIIAGRRAKTKVIGVLTGVSSRKILKKENNSDSYSDKW